MPVIRDIPLSLKVEEVLRHEGFRKQSKIRPEINNLILELLASVRNDHLLEPAIAYEIYSITEMGPGQLTLGDKKVIHGPLLPSLLREAKELVIVVGTIGPGLEKQVSDFNSQDETLRSVLLDGIGSAAVDSLTQEACKFITGEASSRGYQVSSPISPGMPGFPITEQQQVLEMVPVREIGVSLTSSGMMVPRKSASMVMGIGPEMKTWTRDEGCARCNLRKTCSYRMDAGLANQNEA